LIQIAFVNDILVPYTRVTSRVGYPALNLTISQGETHTFFVKGDNMREVACESKIPQQNAG
jgi:hypothetical protein